MRRGVAATGIVLALFAIGACTDDEPPPGSTKSSAAPVSSGSELALARSLARSIVDGIQQGANGRVTTAQADCLTEAIGAALRPSVLADISSTAPDPKALPSATRNAFGAAFDRCLPRDEARQLRSQFGLSG